MGRALSGIRAIAATPVQCQDKPPQGRSRRPAGVPEGVVFSLDTAMPGVLLSPCAVDPVDTSWFS